MKKKKKKGEKKIIPFRQNLLESIRPFSELIKFLCARCTEKIIFIATCTVTVAARFKPFTYFYFLQLYCTNGISAMGN